MAAMTMMQRIQNPELLARDVLVDFRSCPEIVRVTAKA
jgi:hypothetical protein